jgi:hypothetical protein
MDFSRFASSLLDPIASVADTSKRYTSTARVPESSATTRAGVRVAEKSPSAMRPPSNEFALPVFRRVASLPLGRQAVKGNEHGSAHC